MMLRLLLVAAVLSPCVAATQDPREIVSRSVEAHLGRNSELALNYNFVERIKTKQLGGDGAVRSVTTRAHDVLMIEGTPQRRLLEKDGKPLGEQEEREQLEFLREIVEKRRNETTAERAERLAEYEKRRERYDKAIREIPDAFHFRLVGEQWIRSRPAYIIEATPRPGYRPRERYARLFTGLWGKLWVDKEDFHWVRVEAELTDTVSFGWILVRIGEGARVVLEQTLVDGRVWVPKHLWYYVFLRIGLIKAHHVEQETFYGNYRRADTDDELAWITGSIR